MNHKSLSNNEILSNTIDWLRFPLMVAVVFVHMNPKIDMQLVDFSNFKSIDFYHIIATLGSHMIADLAVPTFFLISGFLYFFRTEKWTTDLYLHKTKKRFKTLIIPYLMWNIINITTMLALEMVRLRGDIMPFLSEIFSNGIHKVFWNYYEWDLDKTNLLGWPIPKFGPINLPLWFLRDLIVIIILSPLIHFLITNFKKFGLITLCIAFYTKIWIITPGFNITGIFFFSLGAYFSINHKNIVSEFKKHNKLILSIAGIFMLLSTYFDGKLINEYLHPIFVVSGSISLINLTAFFIEKGSLTVRPILSKASFFIYVTHTVAILGYSKRFMDHIFSAQNTLNMLLKYFLTPLLTVLICVGLYLILKKLTPKIMNFLLGSR